MWGVGDKKVPVGDVGVLLKVEHDVVGGVLLVDDAESEVGSLGALWGHLNVTVSVSGGVVGRGMGGGASVRGRVHWGVVHRGVMDQFVRPYQCRDED